LSILEFFHIGHEKHSTSAHEKHL